MLDLFLSPSGRINRAKFWLAGLAYIAFAIAVAGLFFVLWQIIPGEMDMDGGVKVTGLRAVPYIVIGIGYVAFSFWSGICIAIKRYHDRNKSGAWVLIQLVPVIGGLWFLIEAGCLRGSVGPNSYGPDPLQAPGA